jgi:hypothetical protein
MGNLGDSTAGSSNTMSHDYDTCSVDRLDTSQSYKLALRVRYVSQLD